MPLKGRNKFEQGIIKQLKKDKIPFEYERARLPFTITGWYIPDIILPGPIYVELKGYLRPETRRKMVGVKKENPLADIRFVFQTKETTKQAKAYARWALKNGFLYAFGSIPKEWYKHLK